MRCPTEEKHGICEIGKLCGYFHNGQKRLPKHMIPCVFYQKGTCKNGDKCPYNHSLIAQQATLIDGFNKAKDSGIPPSDAQRALEEDEKKMNELIVSKQVAHDALQQQIQDLEWDLQRLKTDIDLLKAAKEKGNFSAARRQ
jgi:hypothetical protein